MFVMYIAGHYNICIIDMNKESSTYPTHTAKRLIQLLFYIDISIHLTNASNLEIIMHLICTATG